MQLTTIDCVTSHKESAGQRTIKSITLSERNSLNNYKFDTRCCYSKSCMKMTLLLKLLLIFPKKMQVGRELNITFYGDKDNLSLCKLGKQTPSHLLQDLLNYKHSRFEPLLLYLIWIMISKNTRVTVNSG